MALITDSFADPNQMGFDSMGNHRFIAGRQDDGKDYLVDQILQVRWRHGGGKGRGGICSRTEFEVKWLHYPGENTWEPLVSFEHSRPLVVKEFLGFLTADLDSAYKIQIIEEMCEWVSSPRDTEQREVKLYENITQILKGIIAEDESFDRPVMFASLIPRLLDNLIDYPTHEAA